MSVRKRSWKTAKGEEKEAWIVDYTNQSGERHIETFEKKKEADARHDEVRQQVRHGTHISTKLTIAQAGENWIAKAEKGVGREGPLERATIKGYREMLDLHIAPLIGKMPIAKLDADVVNKFEGRLLEEKTAKGTSRSKNTVKTVLRNLSMILADAGAPRNAVRDRPRYRKNGRHQKKLKIGRDIPTPKEVSSILSHAPARWRPLLVLAAFTGLRASELRGLHWEDVDLKRNVITVSHRADRYNEIGSPKSRGSRRKVPFGPVVRNALAPLHLAAGGKGIAFRATKGDIVEHSHLVKSSIIPAAIAAGVPQYTGLHCLRHFYASWCLNRKEDGGLGYSFQQVKELMGHSSITITVDRYGHLFDNGDPNTLEAAETALMALHAT
jgi:integrase